MVRDAVPLGECRRALVVKLRHHGDVLLAAPVISVLKAHASGLEVDALVYDDTAPMLAGHPALAELHCIGRQWRALGATTCWCISPSTRAAPGSRGSSACAMR